MKLRGVTCVTDAAKEVAGILLDIKAVELRVEPPFKWVSGILAPIYTDCRLLMSYPEQRRRVIELLSGLVPPEVDVVAGTASAGIAHAAWLAEKLDKPMVYVRKAKKDHGRENLIEGTFEAGAKVLVVEDLVSTGGSSINTVDAVRAAGGEVTDCVSIFNYGLAKAEDSFKKAEVNLNSLSNFEAALNLALERQYLSKQEADKALEWRANPEGWGK